MPRTPLLFAAALVATLLLALPARGAEEDEAEDHAPRAGNACLSLDQRGATDVLAELSRIAAPKAGFTAVELRGLQALNEAQLWTLIGGRPGLPLSLEGAAALVARLDATGLFAAVVPKVAGDQLAIEATEHPTIARVELFGLRELQADELLERLFRRPPIDRGPARRDLHERRRRRSRRFSDDRVPRCFTPDPPRDWLAGLEDGVVRPGLVWEGLQPALNRLASHLRAEGYALSSLSGSLSADGTLVIEIDEGALAGLDLAGVHEAIRADVLAELGLHAGEPFSVGALRAGLTRVRQRWPFLHLNGSLRTSVDPDRVLIEKAVRGELRFRSAPPESNDRDDESRQRRRQLREWSWSWDDEDEEGVTSGPSRWSIERRDGRRFRAIEIDGHRVRLHLRADRSSVTSDFVELFRHTQVTGFAPGLLLSLRLWDPGDRAHLTLDGLFQINTKRSGHTGTGDVWARIGAGERIDWLFGPKLEIPAWSLAEVGAQIHSLTDTEDRFRISRLDSYVWSLLGNRPESEYFRRTGVTTFATAHLGQRLTIGVEGRLDRYASLDSVRVPVIFNRDEPAYPNPGIDAGLMSSAVIRLEWSSDPVPAHKLGSVWRSTGVSLLPRDNSEPGLRTLATLEVGSHALGADFKFVKFISDTTLLLETGRSSTLRLRARIAGGTDLPLQKQEALGGWEALRGYDFKEFRGDWSLLGTLEYVTHHWGLFADLGSVHQPSSWSDPSLGLGGLFTVSDVRFEAAWRTDQRAHAVPEMRVLFFRTF